MTITTRPAFRLATASLTALILGSGAAMADTWRYAFEEALDEVQGVYAQKFKEEVEANSDTRSSCSPLARWANPTTSWSRPSRASCSS